MMYVLSLSLFFICFTALAYTVVAVVRPPDTVLRQQLAFYEESWESAHDVKARTTPGSEGFRSRVAAVIMKIVSRGRPVPLIEQKLEAAGLSWDWAEFTYYHFLAVCFSGVLAYLAGGWVPAIVIMCALAWSPTPVLDYLISRRQAAFNDQLPEILTMISSSLKAGYSLLQAVDMVAKESGAPASDEFNRVLTDSRLGSPVERALEKMSERVGSTSFDWMIMAVKIQREVGGNLSEVLATLAHTIRERETVLRQVRVLTAEGRLSALILLCLPLLVACALYLLNPGYMSLMFANKIGLAMSVIAITLMVIGAIWLRRVVRIEV